MGRVAAWDLARQADVDSVTLIDRDDAALARAVDEVSRTVAAAGAEARLERRQLDLDSEQQLADAFAGHDVALSSADYRYNEALTRAAIEARVHLCDLGGNLFVVERQLALNARAEAAGVTVIPDCGLAPGMACMLAAAAVEKLGGTADVVRLRVGGLPAHPKPPLNYKLVFSVRGLTNEYLEPAEVLRGGEVTRVPSLTDAQPVDFPPPFGRLEAFHTSGGSSTLPRTFRDRVRELDYKTLRYPGHCAAFAGMAQIGLFSEQPVGGVEPRAFVETLLERALVDDDTDVVLARVSAEGDYEGARRRIVYELIDRHDPVIGHSAMARCTSYPASAVAHLLGTGAVEARGVLPGELALPLEAFVREVRARGIEVTERWEDVPETVS